MKLRPYYNPENIDESKVPDGWRFRYADEMSFCDDEAAYFVNELEDFTPSPSCGTIPNITYIVPVNS